MSQLEPQYKHELVEKDNVSYVDDFIKPILYKGGLAVDDRGAVSFVNDFNFQDVKRFYVVENHKQGFVRAWHAHKKESKYVMVVKGSALIGAVKINDWVNPSREQKVNRYVLSEKILRCFIYQPDTRTDLCRCQKIQRLFSFQLLR